MRRSILCCVAIGMLFASSIGGAADSVQRTIEGYKNWKPTTEKPTLITAAVNTLCRPSGQLSDTYGPHTERNIFIYVNPNGRALYPKIGPLPEGTVIVKEKFGTRADDKFVELGVMIKHGTSWEYSFIDSKGKTVAGDQLLHCARCHARASNDSVFSRPAAKTNTPTFSQEK